jgi:glutamate racemase
VFVRPSFYEIARDYLDPLKPTGIDTLVLGCTHFPLLAPAIRQVMGRRVRIISSAEETAREVAETLAARRQLAPSGNIPRHRFVTTGDADEFARFGARVLRRPITSATHLPLEELTSMKIPAPRPLPENAVAEGEASCS